MSDRSRNWQDNTTFAAATRRGMMADDTNAFRGRAQITTDQLGQRQRNTADTSLRVLEGIQGPEYRALDIAQQVAMQELANQNAMTANFLEKAEKMTQPTGLDWVTGIGGTLGQLALSLGSLSI